MSSSRRPLLIVVTAAVLGGAFLAGADNSSRGAAAQGCDPSYPEICLPSSPDLDCPDIGFPITVIHNPAAGAFDPHALDPDFNGIGCDFG
ncbi:MAG: hypothetical protein U0031_22300 [Thermomicrobiales bacterium]